MNFDADAGLVLRAVDLSVRDGQPVRIVSGSRDYPTDNDDLWDAISNPERIKRWFAPVSGDFVVDSRYQIDGNAGGTIEHCEPPSMFSVTWEFADNVSWVEVTLQPLEKGTRLTLKHILPQDAASESHWQQYGPGATGVGWDLSFVGLGRFFEAGETPVDHDAFEAWLASTPGKTFLRDCGSEWCKAHIESGEDDAVARRMADQTIAFYTGE